MTSDTLIVNDYWGARAASARERKERMMSFGPNARGVLVTTNDGLFVVDPEDSGVSATLLYHGAYGEAEVAFAAGLINERSKVLVVGTHIGTLAIPLAKRCAGVVGIEANPRTFELFSANVLLSGSANIEAHNVLASDKDGEQVKFLLNVDNSGGSKIMPASSNSGYMYDAPEVKELASVRLDTLLNGEAFDLIIMDIEGSEIFALRGMPEILSRCQVLGVEFRTHHIVEVAGLGVDAFIDVVSPFFNWLYVPGSGPIIPQDQIAGRLRAMFAANECHDVIYFFAHEPSLMPS